MTLGRRKQAPDRVSRPVRRRTDGREHSPVRISVATVVSFVAIAVAMWNRAQMQVSVQVVDSCTVGSAADARSSGAACDAPGHPVADTPKSPLSGGHPPIAREETTHDGVTTVVF